MKQFVLPAGTTGTEPEIRLSDRDFHYLIRVRRYTVGDRIPAVTREGFHCVLEILDIGSGSCRAGLSPAENRKNADEQDSGFPRIVLMPAVTRGRKMDLTMRQAVEAGAAEIWPVLTENCQVRYRDERDASAKRERWERILVEALQQCGGRQPSSVENPRSLAESLDVWDRRGPILFLHERPLDTENEKTGRSLHGLLAETVEHLALLVGPEGGFSPDETRTLLESGARPIHLGARVLRAETAALYGLAAVSTIVRERSEWQPA